MADTNTQAPEIKKEEPKKEPEVKMVPESDLLALKGSLEGQLKKAKEDGDAALISATQKADGITSELLKERTAKEQLEKQLKEAGDFKNQFDEVNKELTTIKESIPVYEKKATESKRDLVALKYGVDVKALEGKTFTQLSDLEDALKLAGKGSRASTNQFFDRGSSGGTPSQTPFAVEHSELEDIRKGS
jgi:predicted  nucleic acid-binding Zn-ribbon protein